MAFTASVQPESGRIYMPDPTSRIRFSSIFPKKAWIILAVQNRPGSDLNGLVRVWPNTSGPEASWSAGIIGPGFWQDATGLLPVSDFLTRFRSSTDVLDNTVQNQPGSDLVLADCVRSVLAKRIRSGSKPVCTEESSVPLLANASQPILTGCESDPAC